MIWRYRSVIITLIGTIIGPTRPRSNTVYWSNTSYRPRRKILSRNWCDCYTVTADSRICRQRSRSWLNRSRLVVSRHILSIRDYSGRWRVTGKTEISTSSYRSVLWFGDEKKNVKKKNTVEKTRVLANNSVCESARTADLMGFCFIFFFCQPHSILIYKLLYVFIFKFFLTESHISEFFSRSP